MKIQRTNQFMYHKLNINENSVDLKRNIDDENLRIASP